MASVRLLGSSFNTTSGTHTVTATPRAGELIVIVTASSGNTSAATCTDDNSSGTYTTVETAVKATSADTMMVQIRNALIASAVSTIFTHAPGASTGGGLAVYAVQGMTVAGAAAALQGQNQDNQAAATPAPVLPATPKLWNPIIGAVFNATNPAGMTPRAGYTEDIDVGYATPTSGVQTMRRDEGETSATITWGSASASAFCSVAVELNSTVMGMPNNYKSIKGGTGMGFSELIR